MTIERIPLWTYYQENNKEWERIHSQEHYDESVQRILDFQQNLDDAKRYMLMVRE
jgi:hypothetical protein